MELTAIGFVYSIFVIMERREKLYAMALNRAFTFKCPIGRRLIELCSGCEAVFHIKREDLMEMLPGCEEQVRQIYDESLLRWAEEEMEWASSYGVRLIYYEESDYPARLRECDDSPIILYCMGKADLNAERMLAVVGTRRSTYYGKSTCSSIIASLADNPKPVTIVSGLALGIDGYAHRAALEAGIPTIAVLPTGLDSIYPYEHRELAKKIIDGGGALVTDFSRKTEICKNQFIRRNRIIAGMSDATLLVESFEQGGGLITTGLANSYNREVFAVPGRCTDLSFVGCNRLIENNLAKIAIDASSIEKSMGWQRPKPRKRIIPELDFGDDPVKASLVSFLSERSPVRFNTIFEELKLPTGIPISQQFLSTMLLDLEISGRLSVTGGDIYELIR